MYENDKYDKQLWFVCVFYRIVERFNVGRSGFLSFSLFDNRERRERERNDTLLYLKYAIKTEGIKEKKETRQQQYASSPTPPSFV